MGQWTELLVLVGGLVISGAVHAHVGAHAHGSFVAGLLHPFTGMDHLLAMVAVGLWAARAGARNWFVLPAAFVLSMMLGAGLGLLGGVLPLADGGTAISVLVLGSMVAFAAQVRWHWAVPLVAVFALCHGYMHGAEMPEFSDPWDYFAGFVLATISLHAFGVLSAFALRDRAALLRSVGVAISLAGAWLMIAG